MAEDLKLHTFTFTFAEELPVGKRRITFNGLYLLLLVTLNAALMLLWVRWWGLEDLVPGEPQQPDGRLLSIRCAVCSCVYVLVE
jgi:hypothetical protein